MMITISLDGEASKRARRMLPGTDGAVAAALEDALRGMRAETGGEAGGYKSGWVKTLGRSFTGADRRGGGRPGHGMGGAC